MGLAAGHPDAAPQMERLPMADTILSPRTLKQFAAEVNAAASRAAASPHAERAVGPRSSFWIALGEVAHEQAGERGARPPRFLTVLGRRAWRGVVGLASGLRQALARMIPKAPADGDTDDSPMWAVDALLPTAVLGSSWLWPVAARSWPALVGVAVVALLVVVGGVWQSRVRAARQRNAALDTYAAREIARTRRRRVARTAL
jgi:hypothetical protein